MDAMRDFTGRDINWKNGINIVDPDTGLTPLMLAAVQGKQPIAQVLLERGADVQYSETKKGRTALHIAAHSGHIGVLNELLKRDAMVNCTDKYKKTPLMHAAKRGYLDCVNALVVRKAGVNMTDENGFSALHYAARFGHFAVINALVNAGAAIEIRDTMDGKTALHWAAQFGRKETVISLLDHGAKINRRSTDEKLTALMLACREGFKSIAHILIQRKADANMADAFGWTALHFAASWGRRDTAHILIVDGLAHINAREIGKNGSGGITPLIVASKGGHIEVVKLLLHYGADINLPELIEYHPPLSCAAALGLSDVVQCLIDYGAQVNYQNEVSGVTPLMAAAGAGRRGAIIVLLNHLADMNILDRKGRTAVEHATSNGHRDILLSAVVHIQPGAKANLVPWLELEAPRMERNSMYGGPSVFLTSTLYRRQGLYYGLYQLTGDCDVYLIYCLVMLAAACNQAMRRQPADRPDLARKITEIDQMLLACISAQQMCVDSTFTDAFIVGHVPCAALGDYDIKYFASAFFTGPLALYIDQDFTPLLSTLEMRAKTNAVFFSCTREVGTIVDGIGESCYGMLRARYCPWLMLLLEGAGQLLYLVMVVYYCTVLHRHSRIFDPHVEHPSGAFSSFEAAIVGIIISRLLYEVGQMEEKRWQVSPSVVFDFKALEARRWERVRAHCTENGWKVADSATLVLSCAWVGVRLAAMKDLNSGGDQLYATASTLLVLSCVPVSFGLIRYPAAFCRPLAVEMLTLFAVAKELTVFAIIFFMLGLGFGIVFYAMFHSDVDSFRSPIDTMMTLFNAVLRVHTDDMFDGSTNKVTGLIVGATFLLCSIVVLFNGIIGSIAANFAQHRREAEGAWELMKCRYVQQFLLVVEKSPLCMLPAPLNLVSSAFYVPHVYYAWRARLALGQRQTASIAGRAADAVLYLAMLLPAAATEYLRVYILAPDTGLVVRMGYALWAPAGVAYCALCLLYKFSQDPGASLIIKSRLSDGRLRVSYAQDRDFYEAQALSRFEDQRLHKNLEQFASPLFHDDGEYTKFSAYKAPRPAADAWAGRGFEDTKVNTRRLDHNPVDHVSMWKALLSAANGVVRKRNEDFVGRKIRIAPTSAYLQLAHVQEVDDMRPPGLQEQTQKPAPGANEDMRSLNPEQSVVEEEEVAEINHTYFEEMVPGNDSFAYASQYDTMRVASLPSPAPNAQGAMPGVWWVSKEGGKRTFLSNAYSKPNLPTGGSQLVMSPYQAGIESADQWRELAMDSEPRLANVGASVSQLRNSVSGRNATSYSERATGVKAAGDHKRKLPSDLDVPTNSDAFTQAAPSFYFPQQRFPPIFQQHERKAIFAGVLPDIFRDDFTHAIETSERNLHVLEGKLHGVERLQQQQLALLQRLLDQQAVQHQHQHDQARSELPASDDNYLYY